MRRSIFLLFLVLFATASASKAQDSIEVNGKLEAATVFFAGAELTRVGEVELDSGRNVLVFQGLTPSLEESSIQLEGGKGISIRSVEKRTEKRGAEGEMKERIQAKKDSLEDIEFKLSLRRSMKSVYREEKSMILENKNIKGEQTGTDIEDLMELAIYYRKRLKEIEYKLIEVNNDIEELTQEQQELEDRIRKLERKGLERVSEVIVALEASSGGRRPMTLSYFSPHAHWQPAYELNCPSLKDPVKLTYKGQVKQWTGQDWERVKLTLASGRPTRSGDQPELEPWRLRFRKEHYRSKTQMGGMQSQYQAKKKAEQDKVRQMPSRSTEEMAESVSGAYGNSASPAPRGAVHTRFPIDSRYSIPSDRTGRSVTIKELKIDAEHDHLAIPKLEEKAFLIAKLSGWEATDLFPGEASVQYAGRYVGKTHIDPNITDDTLEVSLGRDQGVVVNRKKVEDKTSEQIIGGKKVLEMGIDIELKNKRQEAVQLRVKDQVPLSGRGDVEVALKERSGATYDKESGELVWKLELGAGESKTLHFAFTVKYPKELDPVGF